MSGVSEASISEIAHRLARLEAGPDDIFTAPSRETFEASLAHQELRARSARRDLALKVADAVESASAKRAKRRSKLESALAKIHRERDERLQQHERARTRLLEGSLRVNRNASQVCGRCRWRAER
jgi:hypothetical protein